MFEAQAWMKGKSKGKTKGHAKDGPGQRSVNAYDSDLFLGGLDVSEAMEITGTGVQTASPSVGMLDCGATASAAPKAIVRSLISAVFTHDKGAKIEFEQSARPYFRFGNGRWGRALCRVHLCSHVSGQPQHFSLYALPNPDATTTMTWIGRPLCQFSSEWTSLGPPLRAYRQPTAPPHPGARAVGN